jgi:hypothetical protein
MVCFPSGIGISFHNSTWLTWLSKVPLSTCSHPVLFELIGESPSVNRLVPRNFFLTLSLLSTDKLTLCGVLDTLFFSFLSLFFSKVGYVPHAMFLVGIGYRLNQICHDVLGREWIQVASDLSGRLPQQFKELYRLKFSNIHDTYTHIYNIHTHI